MAPPVPLLLLLSTGSYRSRPRSLQHSVPQEWHSASTGLSLTCPAVKPWSVSAQGDVTEEVGRSAGPPASPTHGLNPSPQGREAQPVLKCPPGRESYCPEANAPPFPAAYSLGVVWLRACPPLVTEMPPLGIWLWRPSSARPSRESDECPGHWRQSHPLPGQRAQFRDVARGPQSRAADGDQDPVLPGKS